MAASGSLVAGGDVRLRARDHVRVRLRLDGGRDRRRRTVLGEGRPTGAIPGRADARAITLFDSVGFAIEDFSALRYVHDQLKTHPYSEPLDMIADPDDPRDLYGMLLRAKAKAA